ncbi:putative epimerase, PhzC/PhzF-like protein [Congregibacter litoralis KT71]|uniref:Putative epimerase, PhzC/PhzF-like protein n=1 Tax=Congregibacter litoralis KT71 TaxID=314285 RepID=A4A7D5_9GAMM|nr:putative epimerase, PhzC/PhzF-like protein [Congregibacter litoralis KT71]
MSCSASKKLLEFSNGSSQLLCTTVRQLDVAPKKEKALIDPQTPSLVLYAFAGGDEVRGRGLREGGARGNPCQLSLLTAAPTEAPIPDCDTRCLSWRLDDDVCALRCWSPADREIQLCGHGMLCSGAAWLREGQTLSQLEMNGLRTAFHADEDKYWIGLPSISCAACRVPHWIGEFFSVPPWRAAEAGDDDGYLILEWPEGFDLRSLSVPRYALHRRTRRALIVTARVSDPHFDIQLRYFAPQHGVPEDTATGSAMRVLATYWRNRDLSDQLRAQQCSHYGGELHSRIRGDLTWVGGRVTEHAGESRSGQ